tara:strand:- start:10269 stop:10562 length:294 start_codon:yes stop_codon:yes gene_type:complete
MNEALNGLARSNAFGAALVFVIRAVVISVGVILMVLAVPVGLLTPIIPVGVSMGLLGLVLVAAASKTAHTMITDGLRRVPWVWKRVRFAFGEKDAAE